MEKKKKKGTLFNQFRKQRGKFFKEISEDCFQRRLMTSSTSAGVYKWYVGATLAMSTLLGVT
jgi:hypothetical protein